MTPPLILASGSRYKRELMARLALPFEAIPSEVDETPLPDEPPLALARRLAGAKALALATQRPDAFVLGADQVICLGAKLLHKPGSVLACQAQLGALQGQTHTLICAVALACPRAASDDSPTILHDECIYAMHMRPLSQAQIAAYVARDMPLDCAGSYRLEAGGVQLFSSTQGDDHTAIIGLPLTRVMALLERAGYPAPIPPETP